MRLHSLTGLQNRRSYIESLDKICLDEHPDSLILAMFDVDGLKVVNDSLGHDAGDELLQGAAKCLVDAFSSIGTIYRVGGDEYTGIFYASEEDFSAALEHFYELERAWKGSVVENLSVSVGYASSKKYPKASIRELEVMADDVMYAAKQAHYDALES